MQPSPTRPQGPSHTAPAERHGCAGHGCAGIASPEGQASFVDALVAALGHPSVAMRPAPEPRAAKPGAATPESDTKETAGDKASSEGAATENLSGEQLFPSPAANPALVAMLPVTLSVAPPIGPKQSAGPANRTQTALDVGPAGAALRAALAGEANPDQPLQFTGEAPPPGAANALAPAVPERLGLGPAEAQPPNVPQILPPPAMPEIAATAATATPLAKPAAAHPTFTTTLADVPVTVATQLTGEARRFEIRLDPADLGRIDVRLTIGDDGLTRAHLIVERPATLTQLMQDAPRLEQALHAAGSPPGDGGLKFSLSQDGSRNQQSTPGHTHPHGQTDEATQLIPTIAPPRSARLGRLDLFL